MARIIPLLPHTLRLSLSAALLLSTACGSEDEKDSTTDAGRTGGEDEEDAGTDASVEDDAEVAIKRASLRGRVTYADGTALGQVDVQVGDERVKSDSRGLFFVEQLPEGALEVSAQGDGFSRAQVKAEVNEQRVAQAQLYVLPLKRVLIADALAGGLVGDPADFVSVEIPSRAMRVKESGKMVSGPAEARYGVMKQSSDLKAAPGRLRGLQEAREVSLQAFGMIDMRFFKDDEELELTSDATLELPLGPNDLADGDEIDAWSFNAASGLWKAEGRATVDRSKGTNGIARLIATHFSWWAVARPEADQGCVSGTLLTESGAPLDGLAVQAVGVTSWDSAWTETDADGRFCLDLAQSTAYTLSAFGTDEASYFEWKQDVTASAGGAMCGGSDACTDVGAINGASLFDVCTNNVTDNQDHVYVTSSTDVALDALVQTTLEGLGHTVTIGAHFALFDGTVDLSPYDAVYLQANANWGGDMPVAGQRQLINWVNCGGGLVTTEWTTWKIGTGGFQLIDAIFPAARTSAYGRPVTETFSKITDDATINTDLPDSFTFTTDDLGGTESSLNPRPGAVIYYDSEMYDSGLLGWDYNLGRVASFSTTVGTNELMDQNFAQLVANTLNWVQGD